MALIWLILPRANRFTPWVNNCVCFLLLILVLWVVHVQEKVGSSSIFWQCTLLITSKSSAQGTSYIKQSIRTNMNTAHCKTSEKKITLAGFILYSIMQLLFQAYEELHKKCILYRPNNIGRTGVLNIVNTSNTKARTERMSVKCLLQSHIYHICICKAWCLKNLGEHLTFWVRNVDFFFFL